METIFQGCAPGTSGQYDGIVVQADILGIYNLIGLHIFQHTVLMNT